jgi:hypothetical protein
MKTSMILGAYSLGLDKVIIAQINKIHNLQYLT